MSSDDFSAGPSRDYLNKQHSVTTVVTEQKVVNQPIKITINITSDKQGNFKVEILKGDY